MEYYFIFGIVTPISKLVSDVIEVPTHLNPKETFTFCANYIRKDLALTDEQIFVPSQFNKVS